MVVLVYMHNLVTIRFVKETYKKRLSHASLLSVVWGGFENEFTSKKFLASGSR